MEIRDSVMKVPCFKKLARKINGYPAIAYGYCDVDENHKSKNLNIIGVYDVLCLQSLTSPKTWVSLDITTDGYFRILGDINGLEWDKYSSGQLNEKETR